ncbi:WD40-repeat-containing domain protein [Neohortaea acidophila]|uniref:WD40-repeat-containing domain protein n=1 Tax=Neohortaea acidophila TaxID=245834 RepID=A0A6A6PQ75_9PEZI|nr:WD40-repeat-containing domain protein [Neohortaea acidophila]KAF2482258.1 WD40-repeat-containing domain protein [Neohortaea acidophila]
MADPELLASPDLFRRLEKKCCKPCRHHRIFELLSPTTSPTMSMITATAWVPRGHAAAFPTKYVFDEDEYARISKLAKLELEDAKEDLERARQGMMEPADDGKAASAANESEDEEEDGEGGGVTVDREEEDDDLKEYDMEHYDDEPDVVGKEDGEAGPNDSLFGNIKGLAYYTNNEEDPYITLAANDVSDDEREELQILTTDNLLLAARIEDEVAHLETYVYEDEGDNLYVHHDVMLPAMPLCVEWVRARPHKKGEAGSFAAVGTMDPEIELWDLDVVDGMYPTAVLGGMSEEDAGKKKKKKKGKKANSAYHVDSVLALSVNPTHHNLLASGSADNTIKLWDLNTCTAAQSYSHHTDKVCALAWHPTQPSVLLSGSYDRTIVATDMRAPDTTGPRWGVESDVEQIQWDPHDPQRFYVSTENGILHCFDARQLPATPEQSKALWQLQAHDKSLSCFSLNPAVPGFIATGSPDRTVKLWNVSSDSTGPSMVVSRDLGVGKVFSTNFAPDDAVAFRLAVAGSKGAVQVWDTSTNRAVREAFATRVKMPVAQEGEVKERLVGLSRDDDLDDDDDEEEEDEEGEGGEENGWESMEED